MGRSTEKGGKWDTIDGGKLTDKGRRRKGRNRIDKG